MTLDGVLGTVQMQMNEKDLKNSNCIKGQRIIGFSPTGQCQSSEDSFCGPCWRDPDIGAYNNPFNAQMPNIAM